MQLTPKPKQAIWGFRCRVSCDLHELVLWPMFPRVGGWLTFFLIDAPSAFYIAFSFQVKGIPPTTESCLQKKLPELPELCKRRNMLYLLCRHQLTANTQLCICRFIGSHITFHAQRAKCEPFMQHLYFTIFLFFLNLTSLHQSFQPHCCHFLPIFFFYRFWLFNITFAFAFRGIVHLEMFFALNHRFWIVMRRV